MLSSIDNKNKIWVNVLVFIALSLMILSIFAKVIIASPFLVASEKIEFKSEVGSLWINEGKTKPGSIMFKSSDLTDSEFKNVVCLSGSYASMNNCLILNEFREKNLKNPLHVKISIGRINFGLLDIFLPNTYVMQDYSILSK